MRNLTKREIQIRWGMDQVDNIKNAIEFNHRGVQVRLVEFKNIKKKSWKVIVPSDLSIGFIGVNNYFYSMNQASDFAKMQIDVCYGKEVDHVA